MDINEKDGTRLEPGQVHHLSVQADAAHAADALRLIEILGYTEEVKPNMDGDWGGCAFRRIPGVPFPYIQLSWPGPSIVHHPATPDVTMSHVALSFPDLGDALEKILVWRDKIFIRDNQRIRVQVKRESDNLLVYIDCFVEYWELLLQP
jgi:hypothetical protein